jgi:DeoR family transcriptional regulator, aga operon transcriptional repressor
MISLIFARLQPNSRKIHHQTAAPQPILALVRQAERLSAILERLSMDGSLGVTNLSTALEVSAATIRRDLQLLERQRLLSRTHGGAVPQGVLYELPLRYKSARFQEQKLRIAREAASRVMEAWAIGLTGGTTTTEVARALAVRGDLASGAPALTIVTNALNIAAELAVRPNLKLIVTGGVARSASYELIGPLAEATLEGLNVDLAFVGVDGLDPAAGLTTHHEIEAAVNNALIARARHAIAVADSSKLGQTALARICPVSAVDELITDAGADRSLVAALEDGGLTVTVVG